MYLILDPSFLLDKKLSLEEKGLLAIEALARRTKSHFDSADVPCQNSVNEITHLLISLKSKGYEISSIDESNNSESKKTKRVSIAWAETNQNTHWKETALYVECMRYFNEYGHTYPISMYREFIEYWSSIGKTGKERWIEELKKSGSFHIARRMGTWYGKYGDFKRFEAWKKSIDEIIDKHKSIPEKYEPRSNDFFRVLKQYGQRWENASFFPDKKPKQFKDIRDFNLSDFKTSKLSISSYLSQIHGPAPDPEKDIEGYNIYMEKMNLGKF